MSEIYNEAHAACHHIFERTDLRPHVGIVLGSGLGAFADELTHATRIPFSDIPNFPKSTGVVGHASKLVIGNIGDTNLGDTPIAAMQGRVHFYEGYSMDEVIFPMRVMFRMGIRAVILTNAAGGINPQLTPGSLMVLSDHINLQGTNPLIGHNDEHFGARFFDMTAAYDPAYREMTMKEGKKLGINILEGVYIAVTGPSYETPAEIRACRVLGADAVGMSTVPETIAARHMNMKVLAISCVTNAAAAVENKPLDHKEVLAVGERIRGQFVALLKSVIPQIAKDMGGRV